MNSFAESLPAAMQLKGHLSSCFTEESVEGVFFKSGITDIPDKIALLRFCMGVESVSDAPQEKLTPEQEYEDELSIFIEGSWRFLA
jgi:hypothetical protein